MLRVRLCLIIALTTVGVASSNLAQAQPICGEIPKVLVVLDRSGSMSEEVNGQSKWAIAKTAVTSIAQQFPAQLALGLMLYPRWPVEDSCTAGAVNVPPMTNSLGQITTVLNSAYPAGNTPIVGSLDAARVYLGTMAGNERHVILVSDGKETCLTPPEPLSQPGSCSWDGGANFRKCGGCGWQYCLPGGTWSSSCSPVPNIFACPAGQTCGSDALCHGSVQGSSSINQAAAQLMAQGIRTYVVGFGSQIDPQALNTIAGAGGTGSYLQASNLQQLKTALQSIAADISCCGNGVIDAGEVCDTQIPAGQPGACPTSCDDGDPCTNDQLQGQNCTLHCMSKPLVTSVNGDGCCPPGANPASDSDCGGPCGNGVLDPGERCDPQIASGQPGACDLFCDDKDPCTVDAPGGNACDPSCTHEPAPKNPSQPDGCCPAGLSLTEDRDCLPPCDPDRTTNCVDKCQGVVCPDGHSCEWGQCVPWPLGATDSAGCDCSVHHDAPAPGLPWLALGLVALALLRRRRTR